VFAEVWSKQLYVVPLRKLRTSCRVWHVFGVIMIFWDVTLCSLINMYQRSGGSCCLLQGSVKVYYVTSQKTEIFLFTAQNTSNTTLYSEVRKCYIARDHVLSLSFFSFHYKWIPSRLNSNQHKQTRQSAKEKLQTLSINETGNNKNKSSYWAIQQGVAKQHR
jgi:hypothetical protein